MKNNLLIAFSSLVITVVLFDMAAYTLRPQEARGGGLHRPFTQEHPTVGWIGIPHADTALHLKGIPETAVRLNGVGFRDGEFARERSTAASRIVVLDDSFGWGWGVEQDQTYPDLLGGLLASQGLPSEVYNFSVPAYGVDQRLLLWREVVASYQPDLVVVALNGGDVWDDIRPSLYGVLKPIAFSLSPDGELRSYRPDSRLPEEEVTLSPFLRFKLWLEDNSFAYGLLRDAVKSSLLRAPFQSLGLISPHDTSPSRKEWWVTAAQGVPLTQSLLRTLRAEVEAQGSRMLVVYVPRPSEANGRPDPEDTALRTLRDELDLKGLAPAGAFLDLLPVFQEAYGTGPALFYDAQGDIHWTAQGHRLAAETILRHLLDARLLPPYSA